MPQQLGKRRTNVFKQEPRVVLVKILAMGALEGFPLKERDEAALEANRRKELADREMSEKNIRRYGKGWDTGHDVFQKEERVMVTGLVGQLQALGLRLTDVHRQKHGRGKGVINVLAFSREGEEVPMPPSVAQTLLLRFNHCTVWCNMRPDAEAEDGWFRLDTINIAKGRTPEEIKQDGGDQTARRLVVMNNTYVLK